ncbi:MAG: phosphoribosylanthranilate isomerase [Hyphomicrobiaceae bacterium]
MPARVKICGIRTAAAMRATLAAGADFVGLVFFPPSPRNVTVAEAAPLAEMARGNAGVVALTVDADDVLLGAIVAHVKPDMLQLHGSESPERVAEIRARFGTPVMKAIKVETADDAARALAYRGVADLILFDAKAPKGAILPGGNGLAFDWRTLVGVKDEVPFMLSGGLTPSTVATAIAVTNAAIVDVSSGVETSPGEKSPELIREFIEAAHGAPAND